MNFRRKPSFAPPRPETGPLHDSRGMVSVEYALVIATLAAAILASFTGLTGKSIAALSALSF